MRAAVLALAAAVVAVRPAGADDATPAGANAAEARVEKAVVGKGAELPDFDKVRTPDSPAFTLLGVSPTQIERPTTPKQLTAVMSKFVSDGDAVIPKNLAVEFSPYGLLGAVPSVRDYLARGRGRQSVEHFTLSVATASTSRDVTDEMGVTTTHTDSSLAIGARTHFKLSGRPAYGCSQDELAALIDIARTEAVSASPEGAALLRAAGQDIAAAAQRGAPPAEIDERSESGGRGPAGSAGGEGARPLSIDALRRKLAADTLALKSKLVVNGDRIASLCIREVGAVHRGWLMQWAGAVGFAFPDDAADSGRYLRASLWADVAYESDRGSLVFLVRGIDDKSSGKHDYLGDLGARAILAKDAYAVSLEAIWRHAIDRSEMSTASRDTFRAALALDIHIRASTWLTLAFGRDFASSDPGSLFSIANLKYGIGDPKVKLDRGAVTSSAQRAPDHALP